MATADVLNREEALFLSSPIHEPRKGDRSVKSRGMSVEKKIEILESLAGTVSNRRSRRWLNDRLLMELVPRLNAEEIRGLFAPPPFGDDVPLSPFCMTNVPEWDTFRNIDMDKQAKIIDSQESTETKKGNVDADKMAVLNAWRRVDSRTREALRRSVVSELVEGYEERIRGYLTETGEADADSLILRVQDPFRRLLLHGVCEVDAFTESAFKGNPAAVCLLEEDRDDQWLQALAAEFNLSETCYLTRLSDSVSDPALSSTPARFRLRWFTPVTEVDLCGHATLAAASTLFKSGLVNTDIIEFSTLSGILTAKKVPDGVEVANGEAQDSYFIELNFPADPSNEFNSTDALLISNALGGASVIDIRRTTVTDDLLVLLPSGKAVLDLLPQYDEIKKCPGTRGVIVTAVAPPESGYDFYSRFFCPTNGIGEDPVCGSAHCALASYWCNKLGKCDLVAYAASPRGGTINIHLDEQNQRVLLRGKAVTVMEGTVLV